MLAIGLGKHAGALTVHSWGLEGLVEYSAGGSEVCGGACQRAWWPGDP